MMHLCAQIEYQTSKGAVHSDLCAETDAGVGYPADYRELLHSALDEWLDKSNGTGIFYVGDLSAYVAGNDE